jgi:3-hydroxyacyl-CoA dehydrogenase/enoyl-CoA hydratase/3-hydroxybutyryl-CoA epimerase
VDSGAPGATAGRGFWTGSGKPRKPNLAQLPPPRSAPDAARIAERLVSGMVNEAARCLAEGVARERDHVDLATVLGTGFPPFHGGLVRWARAIGEAAFRARLERLAGEHGDRFAPAEELELVFR